MASYGVCLGVIAVLGSKVRRVSAKNVKLVATGNPTAEKKDMIDWAVRKHPSLPWFTTTKKGVTTYANKNEHVADAIAAVHAGVNY